VEFGCLRADRFNMALTPVAQVIQSLAGFKNMLKPFDRLAAR
jgi:hypothetical protein